MGLFTKSLRRNESESVESQTNVPAWLKILQENSWELEILISGGAIFSLFQLSDLITGFFVHLAYTNSFNGQSLLYIFSMLASKGLTLGFFAHILLRSFWVSLVALSSMFNDTLQPKHIKLATPFKTIPPINLNNFIITLDRLSAWTFYNTINLVFILVGWMLLIFSVFSLELIIPDSISFWFEILIVGQLYFYLLDFLLFSLFRRIPYLSYILYPGFKVFDLISLRFLYQNGMNYISQQVARWKTALFYCCFVVAAFVFTYLSIYNRMHWPNVFDSRTYRFMLTENPQYYTENFYRNLSNSPSRLLRIQSDIITEPVINLFINYSIVYDQFIEKIPNESDRYFQNIFTISVDDSLYNEQVFYTNNINHGIEAGITTYIDVSNLKNGMHKLSVINKYETDSTKNHVEVPFYLAVIK